MHIFYYMCLQKFFFFKKIYNIYRSFVNIYIYIYLAAIYFTVNNLREINTFTFETRILLVSRKEFHNVKKKNSLFRNLIFNAILPLDLFKHLNRFNFLSKEKFSPVSHILKNFLRSKIYIFKINQSNRRIFRKMHFTSTRNISPIYSNYL